VSNNAVNNVDVLGLAAAGETCTSGVKLSSVADCSITDVALNSFACHFLPISTILGLNPTTASSAQLCGLLNKKVPLNVPDQTCVNSTCKNLVAFTPTRTQTFKLSVTKDGCNVTATVSGKFSGTGRIGTCCSNS
jgi:hypothetical protein